MVAPIRSLADTLALARAEFGVSWPNPWWPKGSPVLNDCAAFMSWLLFGLTAAGAPRYTFVSTLVNQFKADNVWHVGTAGLQPGDVVAYRWAGSLNNFDHTEMAVTGVTDGLFIARGTNSSGGDNVHDRTRSVADVVGFGRPAYPTTSPSGGGSTLLEDDMTDAQVAQILQAATPFRLIAAVIPSLGLNGWVWVDEDGSTLACPSAGYAQLVASWGWSTAAPSRSVTDANEWNYITKQMLPGVKGPNTSVLDAALSDADVAKLVAQIELPLAQQIASLSSSITQAVTAALVGATSSDQAAIAQAVDAALADNFAALPAAIVKAEGGALSNG